VTTLTSFISLVALVSGIFLGGARDASANDIKPSDKQKAIQVLKQFLVAEEREQYEKCYDFYSGRYKQELSRITVLQIGSTGESKSLPVTTPALYRDLRLEGETRWSKSQIIKVEFLKGQALKIIVKSTAMGEGKTERVKKNFFLIKEEDDLWKIDDIRYTGGRAD
jgi:hypothetical protein